MRIAQIVSHGSLNGVATSSKALIDAQLRFGHEVMLVCPPGTWLARQEFVKPLKLLTSHLRTEIGEIRRVGYAVRDWSADVVHCHGSKGNKFGMAWRLAANSPVVTTAHLTRFRIPFAFFKAVIAPSRQTADYHVRYNLVRRSKIHVISNIANTPKVTRLGARKEFGFSESDFVIAVVGRIANTKNQIDALRILKKLVTRHAVKMLVVGSTGRAETVAGWSELVADPSISSNVVVTGQREDVLDLIADSNALLCISKMDQGPMVVLEAMSLGVPVVTSGVGQMPELIRDGIDGFLFDIGDLEKPREDILKLIADPDLARTIGAQGTERFVAECSEDAIIAKLNMVYEAVR